MPTIFRELCIILVLSENAHVIKSSPLGQIPHMSATLFTHCTLFPGAYAAVIDDAFILVEANSIAAIGPMAQAPPPGTARVVDVRGKELPGRVAATPFVRR